MNKDEIFKQLQELKISSKPGYRIYFEDKVLVMNSGKFVWNKSGEAKNALIGSLKYTLGYHEYYDLKTYDVLEELIEKGIIEIKYYDAKS